jgi:hypothetical protein
MGLSKRLAGSAGVRKGRRRAFRPGPEQLEKRELLAAIDLVNIAGSTTPGSPGPYGVLNLGLGGNNGTGFSITDVGDVNGTGYDSYLVGAPTVIGNTTVPTLGHGNGQVYLIFGSQSANMQTITNWLTLTPNQRVGDLGALGNINQSNPETGLPGFPFNGLTFFANQNPNSLLGASVAAVGDINGDGFSDFLIGAPQALDVTGTLPGTGRAYLIYGGPALSTRINKQVDLDNNTGANSDINIVTFESNQAGAFVGGSVGTILNPVGDGTRFVAIGAPNASLNGLSGNGAVYLVSGNALRPEATQVINLANVGQGGTNNVPGVVFAGSNSGDHLGTSVANAGDFNGDGIGDILMGADQTTTGAGKAYLIYGSTNLLTQSIQTNGNFNIDVNRVLAGATNPIPGAEFDGTTAGDLTGFAVASAADFNGDGVGDIMIGSPGWTNSTGRVTIIDGVKAALTSSNLITGDFSLDGLPTSGLGFVEFDGAATGALTGWSLTPVGKINTTLFPIAIGSPGFNNTQGAVYVIPGNPDLFGVFNLANTQASPIQGTVITLSQPLTQNFLGSSVSSTFLFGARNTVDGDALSDLFIGASGFNPTNNRSFAGGAFVVEGAFLPISNPVSTAITSPIGVGKPLPPFAINATTPDPLTIFIESKGSNTAGFEPPTTIDPTTIKVNGVPLPDPTTFKDVGDVDGDGIDDASFVFSPRSLLNLANGQQTITVTARTLSTSAFPNRNYSGSASVTVTSSSGGGGNLPGQVFSFGPEFENVNQAVPQFGERFLPPINELTRALWKPLPVAGAYRQFLSPPAFLFRQANFFHPNKVKARTKGPTLTLHKNAFTRGKFPIGVHFGPIIHKVKSVGAGVVGFPPKGTR